MPTLNLAKQLFHLRHVWPEAEARLQGRTLIWRGILTPSPLGRLYEMRLTYEIGQRPKIRALNPSLRSLAGERHIPHLYSQEKEELCVYRPRYREWTPSMPIASTVLPWSVLWLYFFEDWLISDDWQGGGEHPRIRNRNQSQILLP